eukprot:m.16484 g.16484  ORF g.16484 m.16484 type:complete len:279 (-) comp5711_c0_seq2:140-976(-)
MKIMKATAEQLDFYDRNGFVVVENVFDKQRMTRLATVALECCNSEMANGTATKIYTVDVDTSGAEAPRKLDSPLIKHDEFLSAALGGTLVELASSLLGHDVVLLTDQCFMKPPHFGSPKPYHQDNFYFNAPSSDEVITCWIALEDADEANGCLRYVSGSHRSGILPHSCVDANVPHNLEVTMEEVAQVAGGNTLPLERIASVKQGGVSFHHGATLHCSGENKSNRWRRGYAVHFGAKGLDLTQTEETKKLLERSYFNRPDYEKLLGKAKELENALSFK